MEINQSRDKLTNSLKFCSSAIRRTISAISSLRRHKTASNVQEFKKDEAVRLKEEEIFLKWKDTQEKEKERIRTLEVYPKTPERPPKMLISKKLPHSSINIKRKPLKLKKPKLPTPPNSPDQSKQLRGINSKNQFPLTNRNVTTNHDNVKVKSATEKFCPNSTCDVLNYLSDDSGIITYTTSDVSDDSDQLKSQRSDRIKRKGVFKYKIHKDNSKYNDLLKKEKLSDTISILKGVQDNIVHNLVETDEALHETITKLEEKTTLHQAVKLEWFVVDMERIVLLLNSLARRLARAELRVYSSDYKQLEEIKKKEKKIIEQLQEANDINNHIKDKLIDILDIIDTYLGEKTKENFVTLLNNKTKLLIMYKELEEKIKIDQTK